MLNVRTGPNWISSRSGRQTPTNWVPDESVHVRVSLTQLSRGGRVVPSPPHQHGLWLICLVEIEEETGIGVAADLNAEALLDTIY